MSDETNLLAETLDVLSDNGKKPQDVLWVGDYSGRHRCSWDEFAELARDLNYDSGYGGNEIAGNLVVVGSDWWLSRGEYDGSEWWNFNVKPEPQENTKPVTNLRNIDYSDAVS